MTEIVRLTINIGSGGGSGSNSNVNPLPPVNNTWYDMVTGLIFPDVLILDFNKVIEWEQ